MTTVLYFRSYNNFNASPSALYKTFVRSTGQSPAAWRRRHRPH